IFCEIADALDKPFGHDTVEEVQEEIERTIPIYKGTMPGTESKQWPASGFAEKTEFQICQAFEGAASRDEYPYRLQTNNHMFHIGSYSQHAKTLVEVGPECFAEIHPEDAEALSLQEGDRIVVESENAKVEVPVKASYVTTRGMVYIPKNWVDVAVHLLRNGDEGLIPIKVSKAG
ncbi:MAG: molybdopterin dinucleotide binding domain-containing protein, partial [Nitrospinales bacterium]